jgi:hypothetical protein
MRVFIIDDDPLTRSACERTLGAELGQIFEPNCVRSGYNAE